MKIYGPFHALNNPLVMTDLGLEGVSKVVDIANKIHERHSNDFIMNALLTGQAQTSMPGGMFRKLASKATGGFISPDVKATPEEYLGEVQALSKQKSENLKQLSEVGSIRKDIGPGPFQKGGPFANLAGPGIDLSGPTKDESKEAFDEQNKTANLKLRGDEFDLKLKTSDPNYQIGLHGAEGEASKMGQIRAESSPAGMALTSSNATTKALANRRATVQVKEETPLGDTPEYTVYDKNFKNLSVNNPKLTWKEAGGMGGPRVRTGSPEDRAIQSISAGDADLDKLEAIVRADKTGKIFPLFGTPFSLGARGKYNWMHRKDPELSQIYSYSNDLIQQIRIANGGRVSTSEIPLGSSFWPDPGTSNTSRSAGLAANILADLGLDAGPSDTHQGVLDKIKKLHQQHRAMALATASRGIPVDDINDADNAIDNATGE